jgi:hypothetical protein
MLTMGFLLILIQAQLKGHCWTLTAKFEIKDEGAIDNYLGVKILKGEEDGTFHLTQPHLIDSILEDVRLLNHGKTTSKLADTPATFENKLHRDIEEE